ALAAVHLAVGAVLIGLVPRTAGPASPDAASARAPGRNPGRPGCAPPRAAPTLAAEEVRMGRGRVDALVVLLLGVWLLATPVLAYGAMITAAPFFGEQPTPAEQGSALRLALAAVGTGLGAPAAGLVVALAAR